MTRAGNTGRRAKIAAWSTVAVAALLAGCTSSPSGPVGAPAPSSPGPTVVGERSLPPLVERNLPSDGPVPSVETAVQTLTNRIDQALVAAGSATPATRMSSKAAAGDQLQIAWVYGLTRPGPEAVHQLRVETLAVLDLVRQAHLAFGTVLLLVTGKVVEGTSTTVSTVLRAKYSEGLVEKTDWKTVSPDDVLGMCDDKPAVVAAGYR